MKIIRSLKDMQAWALHKRSRGFSIGFVPTMGALHIGHQSLVEQSRGDNHYTVVSIFVNPLQFGPQEDLKKYPRTETKDCALLERVGVDVVFIPSADDMYPEGFQTQIHLPALTYLWEGAIRPGHFPGVATVVAKLFQIVQPTHAYFGRKDFQQLRVIQEMVKDLSIPVQIVPCQTIREADGLAFSSRNRYLNAKEREEAVKIHQALYLGRELIQQRIMTDGARLTKRLNQVLKTIPKSQVDYIAAVDPETLVPMAKIKTPVLLIAAVKIGKTRLIDNLLIS